MCSTLRASFTGGVLMVAGRAACEYPAGALLESVASARKCDVSESECQRRAGQALRLGHGFKNAASWWSDRVLIGDESEELREVLARDYSAFSSKMFEWARGGSEAHRMCGKRSRGECCRAALSTPW